MKSGFTLIELSIVLIVIGLLVGGILVASSLMNSAKMSRLIRNIGQYEASVMLFNSQFREYPGDSRLMTPAGDGNGAISTGVGSCIGAYVTAEIFNGWAHLSQSGRLTKNYSIYSPGASAAPSPNCGGTHNYFANEEYADILWPYTEVSQEAADSFTVYRKSLIQTIKESANTNFGFILYVNPLDTLTLESKLGAQLYNNLVAQVGLTNTSGASNCLDIFGNPVACSGEDALVGELYYFIQPQ